MNRDSAPIAPTAGDSERSTNEVATSKVRRPLLAYGLRGKRLARHLSSLWLPMATGAIILGIFEAIHRLALLPALIFPSPFSVLLEMYNQGTSKTMWAEAFVTVQEALLGFAIGSGIGFVLGTGIGASQIVSRGLYPYIILLSAMPRVALAPLFIALFGFGITSKVLIAIVICFLPTMLNTTVGLTATSSTELELMRSVCASKYQTFRKLQFPAALPSIFAGLRASITLAFVGAIVGELSAANAGLGRLIQASSLQLRMSSVIGYVVWLALIALLVFGLVAATERKIVFWR